MGNPEFIDVLSETAASLRANGWNANLMHGVQPTGDSVWWVQTSAQDPMSRDLVSSIFTKHDTLEEAIVVNQDQQDLSSFDLPSIRIGREFGINGNILANAAEELLRWKSGEIDPLSMIGDRINVDADNTNFRLRRDTKDFFYRYTLERKDLLWSMSWWSTDKFIEYCVRDKAVEVIEG